MGFSNFTKGLRAELIGTKKKRKPKKVLTSEQKGRKFGKAVKKRSSSLRKSFNAFAERQAEIGRQERAKEAKMKKKRTSRPMQKDNFDDFSSFVR